MKLPDRYLLTLLTVVVGVIVWSAVNPFDFLTWLLEVFPALAGIGILAATRRRFPLTPLLYTLIALHMIILAVGGHYTYALVPVGEWWRDWFDWSRNHYDRLGHFAQGFVPAMITRELLLRLRVLARPRWLNFLIVSVCMAISAMYELLEWTAALILRQSSDSVLGTQGDVWDTQADMFICLVGAMVAILVLHRWHDRQLSACANPAPSHG